MWGGFNLEYGNLENGYLEGLFISKMGGTGISMESDGYLKNNLKNRYLKKCVKNWSSHYKPDYSDSNRLGIYFARFVVSIVEVTNLTYPNLTSSPILALPGPGALIPYPSTILTLFC